MLLHIFYCVQGGPSSQFVSLLDKLHQQHQNQHQHQPQAAPNKMCDEARASSPSSADSWPELMSPSMIPEKKTPPNNGSTNNNNTTVSNQGPTGQIAEWFEKQNIFTWNW